MRRHNVDEWQRDAGDRQQADHHSELTTPGRGPSMQPAEEHRELVGRFATQTAGATAAARTERGHIEPRNRVLGPGSPDEVGRLGRRGHSPVGQTLAPGPRPRDRRLGLGSTGSRCPLGSLALIDQGQESRTLIVLEFGPDDGLAAATCDGQGPSQRRLAPDNEQHPTRVATRTRDVPRFWLQHDQYPTVAPGR